MLKDLVIANRSYRGFDRSRKISREELLSLIDMCRFCASSQNVQPLKFHVAWEDGEVARIHALTGWARRLQKTMSLPFPGKEPVAYIVICQDKTISENEAVFTRDVGIVAQTILLGATEMGLGGCMIGNFKAGELKEYLNLPETTVPRLLVALGKPDEEIVLTEVGEDGNTDYYRSADKQTHYVPKRKLEDILI